MMPASLGRNSRANVVFPAPFGPAMTMQRGNSISLRSMPANKFKAVRTNKTISGGGRRLDIRPLTMLKASQLMTDPTKRFSNRVENYVKFRPGYPNAVLDLLAEK